MLTLCLQTQREGVATRSFLLTLGHLPQIPRSCEGPGQPCREMTLLIAEEGEGVAHLGWEEASQKIVTPRLDGPLEALSQVVTC